MFEIQAHKALSGIPLTMRDAFELTKAHGKDLIGLFYHANAVRERARGNGVDLCSILSAKTGACTEDCSYCAQSKTSKTGIKPASLLDSETVAKSAANAKKHGARRFCIVTSGRKPNKKELNKICSMIEKVRGIGLLPCATLGILEYDELMALKEAGLQRYHHNLETSRRFFPEICRTHTYDDKIKTIHAVKKAGISLCSGGIFGLGEDWEDRIEMAMELRDLGVDSIPVNFLVPVKGTPLEALEPLSPLEALKIISIYRLLMPSREIRICGGRLQTLGEFNSYVFLAGADGLLTGDCLTTAGRRPNDDLRMIEGFGLEVKGA